MTFRYKGTAYIFSFGFFAVLALYLALDRNGAGIPVLLAAAVHEAGHILLIANAGETVPAIRFAAFGIRMEKRGMAGYLQEALIYTAGPLANLVTGAAAYLFLGPNLFSFASLGLLIFNLLPVGRLDGGQLLRLLLCRWAPAHAARGMMAVGLAVLAPLFAVSLALLQNGNPSLLLTVVYLALCLPGG